MSAALVVPAIGSLWLGQGGIYAGTCRGRDGQPDHHLILAVAKPTKRLTWKASLTWAKKVRADEHKDFSAPDRFECAVLFGNVREAFEPTWYWTASAHSDAGYAWYCFFYDGSQYGSRQSAEGAAVAVRRLPINPSVLSTEEAAS